MPALDADVDIGGVVSKCVSVHEAQRLQCLRNYDRPLKRKSNTVMLFKSIEENVEQWRLLLLSPRSRLSKELSELRNRFSKFLLRFLNQADGEILKIADQ